MPRHLSVKKSHIISAPKKRRGRPPKINKTTSFAPEVSSVVKRRGRPPKIKATDLPKKKEVVVEQKTPQEKLMEGHCFYPAAQWIENNIDHMEEAYLRKIARKHGLTMMQAIMDHMLGYFSIRGSELGKAIRESRKHT
jgi:hypothetical protein